MKDSVLRLELGLRWRDIDDLGHVTHSVYHDFLAEGRALLLGGRLAGLEAVLVHVEIDYRAEVRRDHQAVIVSTELERIGHRSIAVRQEIHRSDGVLAVESSSVLAVWDGQTRSSRPLSQEEREHLERYL